MAFANVVLERFTAGNMCWEIGTYASTGGTTGGTITPATSGQGITGGIKEIYLSDFDTAGATDVQKTYAADSSDVTIVTVADETGKYTLVGRLA